MPDKKLPITVICLIVDQSGSMNSIRDATISNINEYLETVKKEYGDNEGYVTLALFDKPDDNVRIDKPYDFEKLSKIEPLNKDIYEPYGMTPLYDAVVTTIEGLADKVGELGTTKDKKVAVVVAIVTDGQENASKEHDEKCLNDLIKKLEDRGNWSFMFLGANQDSFASASKYAPDTHLRSNALNWQANEAGVKSAFMSLQNATGRVVASAAAGSQLQADLLKDDDSRP